jgi:nicotinamidase-related amidase
MRARDWALAAGQGTNWRARHDNRQDYGFPGRHQSDAVPCWMRRAAVAAVEPRDLLLPILRWTTSAGKTNRRAATATSSRISERMNMTSEPIRDPRTDSLLTPQNAALIVIDYQPSQIQSVRSIDHDLLLDNIVSVARLGKTYGLPIVLSTVNVANGQGRTLPELKAVLADNEEIDRTQINSWEDIEFRSAVQATGRKKLIMAALWTEVCLAFPTLDALREGFEVYPVVDAVGGTSAEAHRAGLERIVQAGAQPISWVSLACELQRDWARMETVPDVVDIVLTTRLLKAA